MGCGSGKVVKNTNDSGADSLREVLSTVCVGDTVTFSNTTTGGATNFFDGSHHAITLTSGELVVGRSMTITGPGASVLTVSGNNSSRVFSISSIATTDISGVTLTGGTGLGAADNKEGGAILNNGTLVLSASVLSGNNAVFGGGGIFNNTAGTATVTGVAISGNTAGDYGGGIRNVGTVTVVNSTISGNTANANGDAGGGIDTEGMTTVINSTISGNSVPSGSHNGGGMWIGAGATIVNSTITNNSVGSGSNNAGGILPGGNVTIRNSIVAANVNNTTTPDVISDFNSVGNNLIGNVANSNDFDQTGDQTGTGAAPLNPQLGALAANGGPTKTHLLLPNSTAINNGNDCVTLAPGSGGCVTTTAGYGSAQHGLRA